MVQMGEYLPKVIRRSEWLIGGSISENPCDVCGNWPEDHKWALLDISGEWPKIIFCNIKAYHLSD